DFDGTNDLLIAGLGKFSEAKAFLLFPKTNKWPKTIDFNIPNAGFKATELFAYQNNAQLGVTASFLGKLNDDKFADIIICGYRDSSLTNQSANGKCMVVYGKPNFENQFSIEDMHPTNGIYL